MKKSDYAKLKKAELIDLAKKKKVRISLSMTKAQMIEALIIGKPVPAKKARVTEVSVKKVVKKKSLVKPKVKVVAVKPTRKAQSKPKPVANNEQVRVKEKKADYIVKAVKSDWDITGDAQKFFTAEEPQNIDEKHDQLPAPAEDQLPDSYGDNKIVAIARDPYCIYLYWELMESHIEKASGTLGTDAKNASWTLRTYDVSGREYIDTAHGYTDTAVDKSVDSHYLAVEYDDAEYIVAIGLSDDSGAFAPIAASNRVHTPRASVAKPAGTDRYIAGETKAVPGDNLFAEGADRHEGSLFENHALSHALSKRGQGASEHSAHMPGDYLSGAGKELP